MSEQQWSATGLTCGHCSQSVTKNLSALAGVTSVNIDVKPDEASHITTVADRDLSADEVFGALRASGNYVLVR
ncbi:unannotated protein [freshwater metagenome]|jgi:copper chaperone CopZ|uniref:Unannotated protein n=1 Tax=freshwater metagenome TaxID=449393 RepID=A0A6J7LZN5_9ZZZZ|nr:heavy metal transporter [Actinomycetota bacterium]MSY54920.1 heavy metal transporter [Actinomycetota bacterium]